ncbi:hypothetical protein GGX14DRAFT_645443 [Mycena pura]|uniref:Uncharacterized protein n=1 Tax=Mycena pura TaxID=153505 RepID=A0AAD6V7U8_9AGAR|nr:hypothetical protein GGX14DRAFT_645443 [Mycena pura]
MSDRIALYVWQPSPQPYYPNAAYSSYASYNWGPSYQSVSLVVSDSPPLAMGPSARRRVHQSSQYYAPTYTTYDGSNHWPEQRVDDSGRYQYEHNTQVLLPPAPAQNFAGPTPYANPTQYQPLPDTSTTSLVRQRQRRPPPLPRVSRPKRVVLPGVNDTDPDPDPPIAYATLALLLADLNRLLCTPHERRAFHFVGSCAIVADPAVGHGARVERVAKEAIMRTVLSFKLAVQASERVATTTTKSSALWMGGPPDKKFLKSTPCAHCEHTLAICVTSDDKDLRACVCGFALGVSKRFVMGAMLGECAAHPVDQMFSDVYTAQTLFLARLNLDRTTYNQIYGNEPIQSLSALIFPVCLQAL